MADNSEKEHLTNPKENQMKNPSDEITPPTNSETIIQIPESVNTKDHLHLIPKKWKEYFLEFLMIFLAVTLGFFADNFREHRADREKERHIIESLIGCLASDTIQIVSVINETAKSIVHLDNFNKLKNGNLSKAQNRIDFIAEGMKGMGSDFFFKTNDGALAQLKSSGMFNLIHKQSIIDSILKYDLINKPTVNQEADYYHIFKEAFTSYRQVVDLSILRDTTSLKYIFTPNSIDFVVKEIGDISINENKEKLTSLHSDAAILASTKDLYIICLKNQLDYGKRLIKFLKIEYDIK